jgi:hypothetical protein
VLGTTQRVYILSGMKARKGFFRILFIALPVAFRADIGV